MLRKPFLWGGVSAALLLGLYFAVLTLVSGFAYAQSQFASYWYFIVPLALGFGMQVGLYVHLRGLIQAGAHAGRVLGVTGTTSTAAMISCCTHYLANILPILGTAGIVTFVSQYQTELFWVGIAFNLAGISYIGRKIFKISARGGSAFGGQTV